MTGLFNCDPNFLRVTPVIFQIDPTFLRVTSFFFFTVSERFGHNQAIRDIFEKKTDVTLEKWSGHSEIKLASLKKKQKKTGAHLKMVGSQLKKSGHCEKKNLPYLSSQKGYRKLFLGHK